MGCLCGNLSFGVYCQSVTFLLIFGKKSDVFLLLLVLKVHFLFVFC